jgi:hypothetical protein
MGDCKRSAELLPVPTRLAMSEPQSSVANNGKAVSPIMARRPFKMLVTRFLGTSSLQCKLGRARAQFLQLFGQVFSEYIAICVIV